MPPHSQAYAACGADRGQTESNVVLPEDRGVRLFVVQEINRPAQEPFLLSKVIDGEHGFLVFVNCKRPGRSGRTIRAGTIPSYGV